MNNLIDNITKYKEGDKNALTEIVNQMTPLIKKYASKIHFMGYEDAVQELYMSLIESIPYLDIKNGSFKCLKYISLTIEHKYYALCKKYLSIKEEYIDDNSFDIEDGSNCFNDTLFNIQLSEFIENVKQKSELKGKIIYLSYIKEWKDNEIAACLNVSKQYVNRIKKKLLLEFLEDEMK